MKITRSKRPERLLVQTSTGTLEDDPAQAVIDDHFGKRFGWLCSSYLAQGERHWLLDRQQSDKIQLIQEFSFHQEHPEEYLTRMDQLYQRSESQYQVLQTKYDTDLKSYQESLQEFGKVYPEPPEYVPLDHRQVLIDQCQTLANEVSRLEGEVRVNQERSRNMAIWRAQLDRVESDLSKLDLQPIQSDIHLEISRLEQDLQSFPIRDYRDQLDERIDQVQMTMTTIREKMDRIPEEPIVESEYQRLVKICQRQEADRTTCSRIGVAYQRASLDQKREEYVRLLDYQKWIPLRDLGQKLVKSISDIPEEEMDKRDLERLQDRKRLGELSQSVLHCPGCDTGLRLQGGKLECCDIKVMTGDEIKNLDVEIKVWNERWNRQEQRRQLVKQLENLESVPDLPEGIPTLTRTQVSELDKVIKMISGIQIQEEIQLDPKILERQREKSKWMDQLSQLENQVATLRKQRDSVPPIPDIKLPKSEIEKQIRLKKQQVQSREQTLIVAGELEIRKQQLTEWISSTILEDLTPELDRCRQEHRRLTTDLEILGKMDKLLVVEKELEKVKSEMDQVFRRVKCLHQFRSMAKEAESEILTDTIETINASLSELVSVLFEAPMTLRLSMFKTSKSTGTSRPQVNLQIQYKGMEGDLTMLSGGEVDRVSVAMLIAFSKLSHSPFLLLDECLSSLDGQTKSMCLELLRQQTRKTVLCVLHDAVEGEFDDVIRME